jgi:two-component system chemotaxis response regulator CheY
MTVSSNELDALLVEPSHVQQRIIIEALHKLGVTSIRAVESGAEALALMCDVPPALVLSAFYLPDMSGTDLVQAMRDDQGLAGIAFILISSETRPQVLDGVRQSGACAILPKPFSPAQLDRAMRATLDFLQPSDTLDVHAEIELEALRVLIVDDSGNSRRFMRRVLENLGIEHFLEAENGRQAVDLLGANFVDLVITDYNMPEMDGKELVEHIRSQSWQNAVPILMVTGEQNASRLAAVEQAGVSAICDKPFESSTIKALIEKALAG